MRICARGKKRLHQVTQHRRRAKRVPPKAIKKVVLFVTVVATTVLKLEHPYLQITSRRL